MMALGQVPTWVYPNPRKYYTKAQYLLRKLQQQTLRKQNPLDISLSEKIENLFFFLIRYLLLVGGHRSSPYNTYLPIYPPLLRGRLTLPLIDACSFIYFLWENTSLISRFNLAVRVACRFIYSYFLRLPFFLFLFSFFFGEWHTKSLVAAAVVVVNPIK